MKMKGVWDEKFISGWNCKNVVAKLKKWCSRIIKFGTRVADNFGKL